MIRALHLGDLLCAVPALRAMRAGWPEAHIALVGLPEGRDLVDRFSRYLDEHISFPGFPGIPERDFDAARYRKFRQQMRSRPFDLAVQLHGNGRVINVFARDLGARRLAGFYPAGSPQPEGCFVEYPEDATEVARLLALTRALGLPGDDETLEFPLTDADCEEALRLSRGHRLEAGQYVVVHPGSRSPDRRWDPSSFARVGDELAGRGLRVVLTGTRAEVPLARSVQQAMRAPVVNLAGRSSLGGMAALLARARLLVANDTGVSHVASALHVPSVVVFTGSDPGRWAPSDGWLHRAVGAGRPRPSSPRASVAVEDVLVEAMALLRAA